MLQKKPRLLTEKEIQEIYSSANLSEGELNNYICFSIVLPFHLGLTELHTITLPDAAKKNYLGFVFRKHVAKINRVKHHCSSVNMILFSDELSMRETSEELLSDSFDMLLLELNSIIFAYMCVKNNSPCYEINPSQIDSMCFASRKTDGKRDKRPILFLTDMLNVNAEESLLSQAELDEFERVMYVNNQRLNPFLQIKRMNLWAVSHQRKRKFAEAVVIAQASLEQFLFLVWKDLYPEMSENGFRDISFKSLIKTQFHEKIGGRWNLEDQSCEAGRYYQFFYELRCKVVHAGYMPSRAEYEESIKHLDDFILFVSKRIQACASKYPRLAQMIALPSER